MAVLLAFVTFLVVAGVLMAIFIATGRETPGGKVRRRWEAVQKAERRGEVSLDLRLLRDEMLSDVPALHRLLIRLPWGSKLRDLVAQAGMKTKPGKILLVAAVLALAGYEICFFLTRNFLFAGAAAAFGAAAPFLFVLLKRHRRLRAFERRFPEALDLLARAVRAGHAFTTGLEMIGKELEEPVAGEFRASFEEQNFGLPLRDALLNLAERVPLLDVRFFATALLIQKETGGNLAEVLDGLAAVIRDRFRIKGEVRVRTAQGRLTAGILIALPPLMLFVLELLNPDYVKVLWTDPWGPYMLTAAGLLQVVGSMILWKIVNIEV